MKSDPAGVFGSLGQETRLEILKLLLAQKIDINTRYANDLTLLMWACGPDDSLYLSADAEGSILAMRPSRH